MWIDGQGNEISFDNIVSAINQDYEVFVGTDSQLVANSWIFATVICFYSPGKGGRFFFQRRRKKKSDHVTLEDRLLSEVHHSVDVADEIRKLRPDIEINVHADISSRSGEKSNKVAKLAENYISGMGFRPQIKPEAWAAAAIADRFTR